MKNSTILVVSPNEDSKLYMKDFFERAEFTNADFVVGKFLPSDKYDFIVFDSRFSPIYKVEDFMDLPEDVKSHFFLLDRYITDSSKMILFFGKYYHKLNTERCASANSKFTLFARMQEMVQYLNYFK